MGYSLLRLGESAAAEKHFLFAVGQKPGNSEAWGGLGLTHYHLGKLELAGDELRKAVE